MDFTPLRVSRDFRALMAGQLVSTLGTQLTAVAVPYQVYAITRSSLDVGLVSLAQLFPLIFGSLWGGSLVDSVDRRKLLVVVEALGALMAAGLAVNADLGSALWPLFVFPSATAALSGIDSSARNAMVPGWSGLRLIPASNALFQSLFQTGAIVGPAAGRAAAGRGGRAGRVLAGRGVVPGVGRAGGVPAVAARPPDGHGARGPAGGRSARGCGSSGGRRQCRART